MLVVTILNLKVKYRSFLSKNMTDKFINSKSCRNRKLCVIMYNKNIEWKMWFWRPLFCFAYLAVEDTKDRMLSDRFEFSTPKLCKNKRKKIALYIEQSFIFQPRLITHTFQKRLQYSYFNIYMPCTNLNTTQLKYTHIWVQKI